MQCLNQNISSNSSKTTTQFDNFFHSIILMSNFKLAANIPKFVHLEPKPYIGRHLFSNHFDTRHWDLWKPRDNDIIIVTPPKCGTTWTQNIVGQIIFNGKLPSDVESIDTVSPWIAMKAAPVKDQISKLNDESYKHRRFVKSHEPIGSIPIYDNSKYIFVGRDYRDAIWSFYNHYKKGSELMYEVLNEPLDGNIAFEEFPRFPENYTEKDYWNDMLYKSDFAGNPDGAFFMSFLWIAGSWLKLKNNIINKYDNILFIHYNDLKKDLKGNIIKIADFMNQDYDKNMLDIIVKNCTFESMKNDVKAAPLSGALWKGGAKAFINKGINGRWKDQLNDKDIQDYRTVALSYMDQDSLDWLENGSI